jgi:sugar-specific transcriptional regulator TrmB
LNSDAETNDHILTLTEFGLTITQAKIYLALIKSNNLTAHTIAALSSVSRPDVYRVLNELQNIGLVEKIIAKPEEFHAISVEESVSLLLQRRIRKTQILQNKGLQLIETLKKTESIQGLQSSRGEFVFIQGKRTAYARSQRMLENLKDSLFFVGLTKSMSAWLTQYFIAVEDVLAKGIDCRIIVPKAGDRPIKDPFVALRKYPNFKVKIIDGLPKASFSIWDKKEILITTSNIDVSFRAATLLSNNRSLIDLCADYFECLWQKADLI